MDAPQPHVVAAIDLLLTIGYIDGRLHEGEQALIRSYVGQLAAAASAPPAAVDAAYAKLEAEIAGLAAEVVASDDGAYLQTRLKVRAVSLFRNFSPADQEVALELMKAISQVDGAVSAHERALHDELLAYFHAAPTLPPAPAVAPPAGLVEVEPPRPLALPANLVHPVLDALEHNYAEDPAALLAQFANDYNLVFQAISLWEQKRALGNGRLLGITDVDQLAPGTRLLDAHVHVLRPTTPTELVVLGDVHGCYSCLKAALLQSRFVERVTAHQHDPANHPDLKLVLLGDYLDRGRFGFEGVLRAALQLFAMFPDHVILLRGNHEYLVRAGDAIVPSVNPAEAVPGIAHRAPPGILEAYRHLFEHMPSTLLFERTLFVHGGIPRDDTFAQRYRDLSSLNDPVLRFEMMWSDPEQTDRVPLELQRASSRFSFGRDQFRAFMERLRCQTMIRGHEQIDAGFATTFDLHDCRLHTLFSAGGADNADLPADSRYRSVTPMALTLRWDAGRSVATPWPIDYRPFTSGANNGFYR